MDFMVVVCGCVRYLFFVSARKTVYTSLQTHWALLAGNIWVVRRVVWGEHAGRSANHWADLSCSHIDSL